MDTVSIARGARGDVALRWTYHGKLAEIPARVRIPPFDRSIAAARAVIAHE
jgi:hypothetical protein